MGKIDVSKVVSLGSSRAPLYKKYPGQTNPQSAYLEMDEDGVVTADCSPDIGYAVPIDVWRGRRIRWDVSSYIQGEALAEFVQRDDVLELLQKVHDGHRVEWDGANHVGRLSCEAKEASDRLDYIIRHDLSDESCLANIMNVADYIAGAHVGELWPANKSLDEVVAEIEDDAESNGVVLEGDTREAVLDFVLRALDRAPDFLEEVHVQALLRNGRISQGEYDDWVESRNSERAG